MNTHVLILGGDLEDAHTLGPLSMLRVQAALSHARAHPDTLFYAAGGIFEDFGDMEESIAALMAIEANRFGLTIKVIGPDADFNTRGELRVFMEIVPEYEPKSVISTWWHLPRIKRIISIEWGTEAADAWGYIKAPGQLTLRLGILETLKWILTFVPENMRQSLVDLYRKLFGRSSW